VFSNKELAEKYKDKQPLPPLYIFKDVTKEYGSVARNLGMTVGQMLGMEDIPMAALA
jgi:hypothetical protein